MSVEKEIVFNNYTDDVHRVYIPILNDDDCVEPDEYFGVRITTDMDCVYLVYYDEKITILDDDSEFITFYMYLLYCEKTL